MKRIEASLVWIFGSPRSGSTWLASLLAQASGAIKVNEPGLGSHLGTTIAATLGLKGGDVDLFRLEQARRNDPDYFFAERYRDCWESGLRRLILVRMKAQLEGARIAFIKEPNGTEGADLIMGALRRSRMIFLLRDGRDVVDSQLDAASPGSWAMKHLPGYERGFRPAFIEQQARMWLWRTAVARRAFDRHSERLRHLVRYEDLLTDTEQVLRRLVSWLDLDEGPVIEAARRSRFEELPLEMKGAGKFVRAAEPGLWRKNLSDGEQSLLIEIMGQQLQSFGYKVA